ncbi:hypothetical protein BC826DRAFT_229204 [Russula brevipes]|nr:hypothetical protein BC826DRAFT_229204 [Russula brevipes]
MMFTRAIVALCPASLVLAAPSAQSEKRQVRIGTVVDEVIGAQEATVFSACTKRDVYLSPFENASYHGGELYVMEMHGNSQNSWRCTGTGSSFVDLRTRARIVFEVWRGLRFGGFHDRNSYLSAQRIPLAGVRSGP